MKTETQLRAESPAPNPKDAERFLRLVKTGVPPLDTTILLWLSGDWIRGRVFISPKTKRLFAGDNCRPRAVGANSRWILLPDLSE